MASWSSDLTLTIKDLEDSVKRKYNAIKQSTIKAEKDLEAQYKPLIGPLRNLTEKVIGVKNEIKQEPKDELESLPPTDEQESLPPIDEVESIPPTEEPENIPLTDDEEEYDIDETPRRTSTGPEFEAFVKAYNIGDLLGTYLKFIQTDDEDKADFTYGIHYDGDEWKMGSYPVSFSDNDIIINDSVYKGTPGLFELIFKKHPESIFNDNDLKTYKQMLEATNVNKKEDGKRIKSNRGYKYTNIISNMFPPKPKKHIKTYTRDEPGTSRKRPNQPMSPFIAEKRQTIGEGLLKEVNNSKIEYEYWDDPNELVERLRLLIASKAAGNTGHNNEIISILEELKEAKIIKDFGTFRL